MYVHTVTDEAPLLISKKEYEVFTYCLLSSLGSLHLKGNSRKATLNLAGKRKMCPYMYSIFITYIDTQKLTDSSKYFPSGQLHPSAQSSAQIFAIESEAQECLQKEEH